MRTQDLTILEERLTKKLQEAVATTVQTTVNGKIDRIQASMNEHNVRHEEDMREVRQHIQNVAPILEAYQGGKILGNFLKWVASVGVAMLVIKTFFFPHL